MWIRFTVLLLVSSGAMAQAAPAASPPLVAVPALTPVLIQLDEEISSERNKGGDRFRLRVAADVRVGDALVIPAGSIGEGEVIHAQKAGFGGKAGELIVAARFVSVGGRRVRLRSFSAGAGEQHTDWALRTGVLVSLPALLIQGGVLIMPRDMVANARTAAALSLPNLGLPNLGLPKMETSDEPKAH